MQFDFKILRQKVCTAYQTQDYESAWKQLKIDYQLEFGDTVPFPLEQNLEEYQIIINWLSQFIETNGLFELKLITRKQVLDLGWDEKILDILYSEPDFIKKKKGGFGVYYLYSESKIISFMDSDEFQEYIAAKKAKKAKFLNPNLSQK